MNIESLREYCLSKPGAVEELPFGPQTLVFKVNNKAFCLCGFDNDPLQFNVKCDPELALELREKYAAIIPGYHMNKKHWNTIIADGSLTDTQLKGFIDMSYTLVMPLKSTIKKKP